jgi:hypothetical protein
MEDALKKLTLNVWEMLNAIEGLDGIPVADRPVSLADADLFDVGSNWLSDGEISKARRELADAISAEKWMQGAQTAIKLLKLLA